MQRFVCLVQQRLNCNNNAGTCRKNNSTAEMLHSTERTGKNSLRRGRGRERRERGREKDEQTKFASKVFRRSVCRRKVFRSRTHFSMPDPTQFFPSVSLLFFASVSVVWEVHAQCTWCTACASQILWGWDDGNRNQARPDIISEIHCAACVAAQSQFPASVFIHSWCGDAEMHTKIFKATCARAPRSPNNKASWKEHKKVKLLFFE